MSTACSSYCWCGRYPCSCANARVSVPCSRTRTTPQAFGRYSHLWASTETESARSMPRNKGACVGTDAAGTPYAPSTWSQTPRSAQTSAISSIGSIAPVSVVPAVATTATGRMPAAMSASSASASASGRRRRAPSIGMSRRLFDPMPKSSTARVIE